MLKRLGGIIKENKGYIGLGAALMLLGVLVGYFNAPLIKSVIRALFQGLDRIARDINSVNNPLYTFWIIFKNNVLAAASMVGLGIFFIGIYPIIGLVMNGIILGFLLKMYQMDGVNPLELFAVGILPHGILELTAIIFAASIGIKFGVVVFQWFAGLFVPSNRAVVSTRFHDMLKDLPIIISTVVVMLFLAAIIESTITPLLLHGVMGEQIKTMKHLMK
ncbi:stage II sporulation protein M [Aneurinibacillus terranovensis]|uniref:stage II sporulation protein M n=1 Tax=Aneurinibacillus terranovensis TaxID=278991 RepID=UPI0003F78053|nr:stage II sporulation protein M [Aneurinibacillus terranovensis]